MTTDLSTSKNRSIAKHFSSSMLLILTVATAIVIASVIIFARKTYVENRDQTLNYSIGVFSESLRDDLLFSRNFTISSKCSRLLENNIASYVNIVGADGKSICSMGHEKGSHLTSKKVYFDIDHPNDVLATITIGMKNAVFYTYVVVSSVSFLLVLLAGIAISYFIFRVQLEKVSAPFYEMMNALDSVDSFESIDLDAHRFHVYSEVSTIAKSLKSYRESLREHDIDKLKLTKRDAEISVYAWIVHNLSSPINSLSILIEDIRNKVSDRQFSLLCSISDRLDYVIKRAGWGNEHQFLSSPVNVKLLLEQTIEEKRLEYRDRDNLSFRIVDHVEGNLMYRFNENGFKNVISNLLNNSVEAHPKENSEVVIDIEKADSHFFVSVSDYGYGVSESIQDEMFLENFTSGKASGKGIGLFDASKYCQKYGGSIRLKSARNPTVFQMNFPL